MLPPPPDPPPHRPLPPLAVIALFGLALLIAMGAGELVRAWWSQPLIDAASVSRPPSAPGSSGPAYDATASAALAVIAQAVSTSVAPTPTPVPATATPKPRPTSTPIPPVLCGSWVNAGEVCEWGKATMTPSPTPPPCVTPQPGEACRWRGSPPGGVS